MIGAIMGMMAMTMMTEASRLAAASLSVAVSRTMACASTIPDTTTA